MDSMPRRYPWHDFQRPGHYLFTLKGASRGRGCFTRLDSAGVFHDTPLGALVRAQWRKLEKETAGLLAVRAFQLMPDHLHAQVEVVAMLPKPVGNYIGRFKALVTGRARRLPGFPREAAVWEPGYDWRKKTTESEIAVARAYVGSNPAQLLLKRAAGAAYGKAGPLVHPRLPSRWPDGPAGGAPLAWTSFGNAGLLDGGIWPLRVSRRAGRADTDALVETALARGRAGDACISPAISPGEKEVFQAVVRAGCRAILLAAVPLGLRYHPASWAMEALAAGRFLVLSPLTGKRRDDKLSRVLAGRLNACAAAIARGAGKSR